jgi:DNA (cytosine-5)-methyltransferase 1
MKKNKFKFIDLFAGIGGFHQAMASLGGECVFASEIDENARKTYEHNYKEGSPDLFKNNLFNKDIKSVAAEEIPDFDVLCAGFPCQPFSQAGKKHGFTDTLKSERGNLFFDIAEIIETKKPKAFFLENVRGLFKHDNGATFKVIEKTLTEELGYSIYYQIVKASDYGLPQLRPRLFIIGFRDDNKNDKFAFPEKLPLKFNMSDVWGGDCSRELGFTIRVGGRGSNINDRRNWDSYLVDGEVKKLSYIEARKMQGFPDHFHFPVSATQAMKQLGNSVAVDAIKAVSKNLIDYMNILNKKRTTMKKTNNKGEWTELFAFIKILHEQRLYLCDKDLEPIGDYFKVNKVTTKNIDLEFIPLNEFKVNTVNPKLKTEKGLDISKILTKETIANIANRIKEGKGTFEIEDFEIIQNSLGFSIVKGGTSYQKADILLDIEHDTFEKENEGFGIKSYLGAKPTLLNASSNTNFIFEVTGLDEKTITEVNKIDKSVVKTWLKARLEEIEKNGGKLKYLKAEKDTMNYNLKMVDSSLPEIVGYLLKAFYAKRISKITEIVEYLCNETDILEKLEIDDKEMLISKIKKFLVDVLLGFFAGRKWDGTYESNGTIVVKQSGELATFHIIHIDNLKDYLYEKIRLDTPSTSRHKFGTIIQEKKKTFLKLNLQLRF